MKKNAFNKIAIVLVILGAVLRLVWLGKIPSGFFRDEAALGYNAYSIWKTGADEFGMKFPIVFRSFEVFFLPLYVYLTAPIVGILGLSEFSTRFLSSISGIFALPIILFIVKEIWDKRAALFSMFILTISPWHIFFSRGTFEGNLALTLFAAGFLFWLRFLKKKSKGYFFLSSFLFAASMYSYQSERLVVAIFSLIAISFSFKTLWKMRKKLVFSCLVALVFLLPLFSLTFKSGGYHRALGVSIFSQQSTPPGWIQEEGEGVLVNNRIFLRGRQMMSLYLSYFSPRNLFIEGDYNQQRTVDDFSVFFAWMLPFMLMGFWQVIKRTTISKKLLLTWTLIAPLPAALTGDPFHTYRSLLLYFPLTIMIGLGMAKLFEVFQGTRINKIRKYRYANLFHFGSGITDNLARKQFRVFFMFSIAAISGVSLFLFLFNYAVISQATRARDWDYGYREIYGFVSKQGAEKIVIDDIGTEAYIYFLFFGNVDPKKYHDEVKKLGNVEDYYYTDASEIRPIGFENYEFRQVDWPSERGDTGTIFVMTAKDLPESEFITDPKVELLHEIKYPDGKIAYRIVRIF